MACGYRFVFEKRQPYGAREGDTIPEGQPAVRPKLARTQQISLSSPISEVTESEDSQNDSQFNSRENTQQDPSISENHIERSDKRRGMFITSIFLTIIVFFVLLLLLTRRDGEAQHRLSSIENSKISIPGGKVILGISGEAKAVLLLACQRTQENEKDCDEDALLGKEKNTSEGIVSAFQIDKYEVSNRDFNTCVANGRCEREEKCEIRTHEGKQFGSRPPKIVLEEERPAVCISALQAQHYCEFKGGRLPSQAQFLRAARASTQTMFPWGNHWDPAFANWGERDVVHTPVLGRLDGYGFTAPVGSFKKGCSKSGVCDLSGNVAEWGEDETGKFVYRGGSWTEPPFELRVSLEKHAEGARTDVGFRCVYTGI